MPVLHLAWQGTGDAKFLEEIQRWYDACDTSRRFGVPSGSVTGSLCGRLVYWPAVLMEMEPANHELWRSMMLSNYARLSSGVLADGTTPTAWVYDRETGKVEPRDSAWGGGVPARTGRSAVAAMSCVAAHRWFPQAEMASVARHVLEQLDEDTFRFVMPMSEDQPLPPSWQVESKLLDHDSLTAWLWAYWEGRYRGYW